VVRVLYLEDEEDTLEVLPLYLREEGIEIIGTLSIEDALQWVSEQSFDAVLLDIMMPPTENMDDESLDYGRLTGIEVARRVKAIKPGLPIVAFTVLTDREIRKQIRDAGVIAIISKPCEPDVIADTLLRVIRNR
jgi:CheY-like chemotaxis protein